MQIRILLFFIITIFISSCATQNKTIVATYGDYEIPIEEFEQAYEKSVGGLETAKSDSLTNYKNFLDLYVNFKMKLRDAELRGFKNNQDLQKEYKEYRDNLGETYLLEKEVINPGLRKLYELRKNEVRASHILISIQKQTEEEAYEKAKSIINEINNGAGFDSLANVYSDDTYTKSSGGDVFYLVAGTILPDLEDAIYSLNVGEVYREPVKTRFGYHIIKLTEKIKFKPTITASHILASVKDSNNAVDTLKSLEKIKEIKAKLDSGEDFAELAKQYSDDKGSGLNGGSLGAFKRRAMVRQFDEAAFKLKVGETSGIVQTNYGYHIIQLTGEQEYPSFAEDRENLIKLYKQSRYNIDLAKYYDSLKNQFNYSFNSGLVDSIDSINDSVKFDNNYFNTDLSNAIGNSVIFKIKNDEIVFNSLVSFAALNNQFSGKVIKKELLQTVVDKLSQKELLKQRMLVLENQDSEFSNLMNDYRNGLYIFKIQEEEVWKKLDLDSNKAFEYYQNNKNNYVWPDRVNYSEIFIKDSTKAFALFNVLQSGGNFDEIAGNENDRPALKSKKGQVGIVDANKDELSKLAFELENTGEIAGPIKTPGGWSIIKLNEKLLSQIKSFDECRAEVMSAFQELESKRLEEEYLERLNNLYHPVKNYDELKNVFSSAKNISN